MSAALCESQERCSLISLHRSRGQLHHDGEAEALGQRFGGQLAAEMDVVGAAAGVPE